MLNRTPESFTTALEPRRLEPSPLAATRARLLELLQQGWYLFVRVSFSSLTRRIIFLNVTGLLALVVGILAAGVWGAGRKLLQKPSALHPGAELGVDRS